MIEADYNKLSLNELESKLAEAKQHQIEAYSDFIWWACQNTIEQIEKAIKFKLALNKTMNKYSGALKKFADS